MSVGPTTVARIVLLLLGIVAFGFALNTGADWARWVAIACVAAALIMRFVSRGR